MQNIIDDIKTNIETLTPHEISNHCIHLSILMQSMGDDLARAEMDYNRKWDALRIHCDTDTQAEKKSKQTEEYYKKKMLEYRYKSTKELINSLKKRLMVLSDEAHNKY